MTSGADEGTIQIRKSKTEAGQRAIALSPDMARRLAARRASTEDGADEDPIFPTVQGTAMDPHNWRSRVFRPAAKRAGLP